MAIYFVTGTDTDAGKTVATGLLAKWLADAGKSVVTHKAVQTGCDSISLDIEEHRRIMGTGLQQYDIEGDTCPYLFQKPCSPHLAALLENRIIEPAVIKKSTEKIAKDFEICFCEGAGGLMVPLSRDYTSFDFIKETGWPVILVCSSKLGSINHSFMSLEILFLHKIDVKAVIYNEFPAEDSQIVADSKIVIEQKAKEYFPNSLFYVLNNKAELQAGDSADWNL